MPTTDAGTPRDTTVHRLQITDASIRVWLRESQGSDGLAPIALSIRSGLGGVQVYLDRGEALVLSSALEEAAAVDVRG